MVIDVLVITVLALLSLAGAVALMVSNREKSNEGKISLKDLYAYICKKVSYRLLVKNCVE